MRTSRRTRLPAPTPWGLAAVPACCALLALGSCGGGSTGGTAPAREPLRRLEVPQTGPTLFTRLGGLEAIRLVVDDFASRLGADPEAAPMLRGVDVDTLKQRLVEQICQATGGGCRYRGRSMRETHRGLGITDQQFDRAVGFIQAGLARYNVPERERQELLGILAPLRREIVGQ